MPFSFGSNNTNKLSPQELNTFSLFSSLVQIIQINLVLKNDEPCMVSNQMVQIIQINLVLKNSLTVYVVPLFVQIIQINLVLKNMHKCLLKNV